MNRSWIACFAVLWPSSVVAEDVVVAVASNFLSTAEEIVAEFEAETGHDVMLEFGATGLLFAQINSGAPFDVLLAADATRPAELVASGQASDVATYAVGSLVLLASEPVSIDTVADVIAGETVALADPILAPYGNASIVTMERLGLDTATFQPVLVANVGQVASIFAAGDAAFAFAAASSVAELAPEHVLELEEIAPPIRQDAALLSPENPGAAAFWDWLFSERGRASIAKAGYRLP
ncbi:MAG: molybdate ABC transporter substrate-binding protein [Pseudomonadota bacterium]